MKNFFNTERSLVQRLKGSKKILKGIALMGLLSASETFGQCNMVANGSFAGENLTCLPANQYSAAACGASGYRITNNPVGFGWPAVVDATPGGGTNFMVVDAPAGTTVNWAQQVSVVAGTTYTFKVLVRNFNAAGTPTVSLNFSTNAAWNVVGMPLTTVALPAATSSSSWTQLTVNLTAATGNAWIQVVSNNAVATNHDYALDEISFGPATGGTPPAPTLTLTPASACAGAQVNSNVNYGSGNTYTYVRAASWTTLGGGGGPGGFGEAGTMTGSGTFTLTAKSPAGCYKTVFQTVTITPAPTGVSLSTAATGCVGERIQHAVSYGASNNTVSLTKPPLSNVGGVGYQGGYTEWGNLTTAGTFAYVLKVTNPAGCSVTITKNITVNTPPATPTAGTPADKICKGESVQLTSNPAGGTWSVTPIGTSPVGPTVSASGLFTGVTAGAYAVAYKVTNASGCSASAIVNIAVGALPFSIDGPNNICINNTYKYTVLQEAQGNVYTWRRDGNFVSTLATNTATTADLYSGNPGTVPSQIVLTAQGDFTCLDGTKRTAIVTKTVNYVAAPSGVLIKCADATCNTLTATNSSGLTLRWYHSPSGTVELGSATTITNPKVNTTIGLEVTNSAGCKSWFYWYPFYTQTCNTVYDNNKPLYPSQGYGTGGRLANANADKGYQLAARPNPASDFVSFESDGLEGEASVFNSQGELIETIKISAGQKLYDVKVANYASGMYYLQVYSSNGKVYSTPIVKE